MHVFGWFVVLLCEVFPLASSGKKTRLVNNGYEGVVIAIDPRVPEDSGLLAAIQSMMTDASGVLFRATRNRAYFKEITILVPEQWREVSFSYASSETYESADIRVAPPRPSLRDNPYAWVKGPCGSHGQYIHLTPAYITQDRFINGYGPRGKVVVHEWAHYRWGVRDEYPTGRNAAERHRNSFYYTDSQDLEATRCSLGIRGKLVQTGRKDGCDMVNYFPAEGCTFRRFGRQLAELSSSLMYATYIDEVSMFCHDDPSDELNQHNKEALNNQNKFCDYRSAWDVIMDSADFQRGTINDPNPSITSTTPNFKIVKHQSTRVVLVLDTSGSMTAERLRNQRRAAELLISSTIGDGTFVGLVQFSSSATRLQSLTKVYHGDSSREDLVRVLPSFSGGSTGIGSGILEAVEVLEESNQGTAGGQIIVLTDGEENTSPFVNDVAEEVIGKRIVVHAVFFGLVDVADGHTLANLSLATEGNWYFATDSSTQLQNIFATLSRPSDGDLSTAAVQISSSVLEVESGSTVKSAVAVDSSIGNRTEFIFSWSQTEPEVEITPPSSNCIYSNVVKDNVTYCSVIHVTDIATKAVKFTIPGTAKVGRWEYAIKSTLEQSTTLTVTSAPSTDGVYPITVEPELQFVNVSGNEAALVITSVHQNQVPVLGANVTAVIVRPQGEDVTMRLFDSGSGADAIESDGVYSRYFTNFSSHGRYSIEVRVLKNGSEPAGIANIPRSPGNPGVLSDDGTFIPNPDYVEPESEASGAVITGNLERIASSPGIGYTGSITANDTYPPNKITDLSATQIDLGNATAGVRLTFTAPGDDFDSGTASRYDVRVTNESAPTLLSEFDQQIPVIVSDQNDLLQPKSTFEKEEITVFVPPRWAGQTVVRISIAIRSYDEADNPSEISNIASTTFFFEPPPLPNQPEGVNWTIVGGATGGGVVLIILLGILCYVLIKRRKKD